VPGTISVKLLNQNDSAAKSHEATVEEIISDSPEPAELQELVLPYEDYNRFFHAWQVCLVENSIKNL